MINNEKELKIIKYFNKNFLKFSVTSRENKKKKNKVTLFNLVI